MARSGNELGRRGRRLPLVSWTSTTTPTVGHVFDVRVNHRIYTIVFGGPETARYVEAEAYASLVTAVQNADAGASPHVRAE